MNKLKMLVLMGLAAATVGTGALAAAPSASAVPPDPPKYEDAPCFLKTSLGVLTYQHMDTITVRGYDGKKHAYLCWNGSWLEVKALTTPTATYTGSFATVLTRV
jgi:hypothetical protein